MAYFFPEVHRTQYISQHDQYVRVYKILLTEGILFLAWLKTRKFGNMTITNGYTHKSL
jgi:hypothetical protein